MPTENELGATGTPNLQKSQGNSNSTSAAAPVTEGSVPAEGLQTGRQSTRLSCDRSDSLESLGSSFSGKNPFNYKLQFYLASSNIDFKSSTPRHLSFFYGDFPWCIYYGNECTFTMMFFKLIDAHMPG